NGKRETGKVAAGAVVGARSRSFFTTRPPGPEPVTSFRSTPVSFAIRRASGEAFTRVASVGGAASAVTVTGAGAVATAAFPVSRFAFPAGPGGGGAAVA